MEVVEGVINITSISLVCHFVTIIAIVLMKATMIHRLTLTKFNQKLKLQDI